MVVNVRKLAGAAVILGALPYLALKTLWLTGNPVGLTDPGFANDSSLRALNLATGGMDAVAILVALALTQNWGQRLPAWVVLVPIWIGTGFLTPILLMAPLIFTEQAHLPLESWVQPLVYSGFVWQGAALLLAFVLYVRVRWPWLARARRRAKARTVTSLAGAVLGLFVAWAEFADGRALDGFLALAGVLGVSAIVEGWWAGGLVWPPAVAGWVGTGAMFSWGAWGVVNVVGGTVLASGADPVAIAAEVSKVLAAVLLAYGATRSPDLRTTRYASAAALP
ncbi:hypothetical protein [Labedaea rhizosphaerae]|uniref:Uncharacterized protein n=1 Tax=Labedaea rhizosphaerae TaxID=598644 RepID=A0A4R6SNV7_LABRH|nr:hypothetical protein [Labedaea rhizosphaerae]TDQ05102.1 hypothetical protein EV186_1011067 [Labedaea rhizosphaerae]